MVREWWVGDDDVVPGGGCTATATGGLAELPACACACAATATSSTSQPPSRSLKRAGLGRCTAFFFLSSGLFDGGRLPRAAFTLFALTISNALSAGTRR